MCAADSGIDGASGQHGEIVMVMRGALVQLTFGVVTACQVRELLPESRRDCLLGQLVPHTSVVFGTSSTTRLFLVQSNQILTLLD